MDIKERMANVGMTQVDMILELQKRGYSASLFARVDASGNANYNDASDSNGVRPVFLLS